MKFSVDWLRQYVDLPEAPERIAALLAEAGLPVDAVEPWGADHLLDVDVMANRPDCMGHVGIARELAARLKRPLRLPAPDPPRAPEPADTLASVDVEDAGLCSRYTALVMTGVHVGESPDWLVDRLASIGLRPVNNVVDVTNFVLHELGQPLHAFDLDRLEEHRIVVRRPRAGETLCTLDGVVRELEPGQLVIADGARPVALAGIMGGSDSEIGPATRRILIESAHFDPRVTRRTSRTFQMHTDASHRFERGTDPGGTLRAALRAAELILAAAGGSLCAGALDVGGDAIARRTVSVSRARAGRLLGLDITASRARRALSSLGFEPTGPEGGEDADTLAVRVPTWRGDVRRPEDLVEEIGRMVGYDEIPFTLPVFNSARTGSPSPSAGRDRLRRYLVAAGVHEALTFPMHDREAQDMFAEFFLTDGAYVQLDNPLTLKMATLRISLLPGLLDSLQHNTNRGATDVRLFEIGRTFVDRHDAPGRTDDLPRERHHLAVALHGHTARPHFRHQPRPLDYFDLKGLLEGLASTVLGWSCRVSAPEEPLSFLAEGAQGVVELDGRPCGFIGRIAPETATRAGFADDVHLLEIDITGVETTPPPLRFRPPPRYPEVERDLALLLDAGVTYERVAEVIRSEAGDWLEAVRPFDRYAGKGIPAGRYSLAVRLSFRHPDRTLTADEVQEIQDRVVRHLEDDLGAVLRDAQGAT